jgi:hypothetical protein
MNQSANRREFDEAAKQYAPLRNLQGIRAGDHYVQFYENEDYLIQAVGSYVAQGFIEGHSAVLILTAVFLSRKR